MATAHKLVPFEESVSNAAAIFEEIARDGGDVLVEREGKLYCVSAKKTLKPRKSGILTQQDTIFNIIGMAKAEGPTDVSANKHKYLADAYADKHNA